MKLHGIMKGIVLIALSFQLGGCAAALVPIAVAVYASTGYAVFKTVQTSTGGTISIRFIDDEESINNQVSLTGISIPAIWPNNQAEVYFAEKMQDSGSFESVITPLQVSKALRKLDIDHQISNMTGSEMKSSFKKVCEGAQADSVIAFQRMGTSTNTNMLSFDRGNIIQHIKMIIYSSKSSSIVYETVMEVKSEFGEKIQGDLDDPEVLKIAAEAAAEKIILLTQS